MANLVRSQIGGANLIFKIFNIDMRKKRIKFNYRGIDWWPVGQARHWRSGIILILANIIIFFLFSIILLKLAY